MKAASPDRRFSLLLARWKLILEEHPDLRPGQALWNVAFEMYEVTGSLCNSGLDAFDNDRAIPKLLHFLLWQNQEEDT
jgi:hypothetical protein